MVDGARLARRAHRLALACLLAMAIALGLTVVTASQVAQSATGLSEAAERERAAASIDAMVERFGPITVEDLPLLSRLAGLGQARLAPARAVGTDEISVPLLAGQGMPGQHLVWTAKRPGAVLVQKFAYVRLPLIMGCFIILAGLLGLLLVTVRQLEGQRRTASDHALRDPMTGLPNRRGLDAYLAGRPTHEALVMMVFDLDGFKQVNDQFGHAAGDAVLQAVARRGDALRGADDLLARLGGDEFVLCGAWRSRDEMTVLARAMISGIEAPVTAGREPVRVAVSMGIALGQPGLDGAILLGRADRALYRAKAGPGSMFCFADAYGAGDEHRQRPAAAVPGRHSEPLKLFG